MAKVNYRHQKNLREQQKKKRNDEKRQKKARSAEPADPVANAPGVGSPGARE